MAKNGSANHNKLGLSLPDSFAGYSPDLFAVPQQYRSQIAHVLIPHGLIQDRIEMVAAQIFSDYAETFSEGAAERPLQIICVMKGASIFTHDLVFKLQTLNRLSGAHGKSLLFNLHFIRAKSYSGTSQADKIDYQCEKIQEIRDSAVERKLPMLVIEDIIDSGRTLYALVNDLKSANEELSVRVAVLCHKRIKRTVDVGVDYCCFDIPNKWVIGYGFDIDDRYRDMSHICVFKDTELE